MSTNPQYRLSMTAAEIERLLLSISEKTSPEDIVYDYAEGGATGKVAAASAVKNMWLKLNEMVTGEGLKAAINAAEDSNVFTDKYKSILDRESFKFIGSPADLLARDDIDTTNFDGGEVILLQKNASGNPEFQYWKRTPGNNGAAPTFEWEAIGSSGSNDASISVPAVGTQLLKSIPKVLFHMVEFRIHAYDTDTGHWQSIDGKLGYRGDDLLVSEYNGVKSKDLITIAYNQSSSTMDISITTLQKDIKCYLSIITGY